MAARIGVSATSSYSASDRAGTTKAGGRATVGGGAAAGVGTARTAGGPPASAPSTSRRTMRPAGPLPAITRRSRPDCAAIFLASGDAFTRPVAGATIAGTADAGAPTIGTTFVVAGSERYVSICGRTRALPGAGGFAAAVGDANAG